MVNWVTVPAGWELGAITSKLFRHTYCSARLATLDRGAPVSQETVFWEMGHSSRDLVERPPADYPAPGRESEYRVEQHEAARGDRLTALRRRFEGRSGTTVVEAT